MKTAIIILNWNGKTLLERFLPSVVANSKGLATVYLADNASTDDSIAFCQKQYPEINIIKNKVNGGYARGYNDALAHIDTELYVLLNSDVETPKGWLAPMISLFEHDAFLGAAQPKILDLNKKTHFEYAGAAGGFLDTLGYPFCRGRIFDHCEEDNGQYNDTIAIDWASGACLFIRAAVFNKAGKLDEDYFAHQEEIDLCWRVRNTGYKVLACGDSYVYHLGGATLSNINPKKSFYNFRNSLFTIVKNEATGVLWRVVLRLLLDGIAGLRFLLQGKLLHLWAIIKAHWSFYYYIPRMMTKRQKEEKKIDSPRAKPIVFTYFLKGIREYTQAIQKR